MRSAGIVAAIFLLVQSGGIALASNGPQASNQTAGASAEVLIAQADFWQGFNECDADRMASRVTLDVEFYHDKEGMNASRELVVQSLLTGPCSDESDLRLRREAVAGSEQFHSLAGGYALLSGEHRFFTRQGSSSERHDSIARFQAIWQNTDDGWQMRRIVSYDHRPDVPVLVAIALEDGALTRFAGDYALNGAGMISVRANGGILVLGEGPDALHLVPLGEGLFGVEGRWLQIRFPEGRLEVHDEGQLVDSGPRQAD